jgi:DNA-binding MarR family transcriptional regulator
MPPPSGAALLLSRLGAHAAARLGERLQPLGLTPAHVGVLRLVAAEPGLSQQTLAERIGAAPSRVVKLLDELEDRHLLERRRSATDRRHHEVHLASAATEQLGQVRRVVSDNDAELTASLTPDELATLLTLLEKLADSTGLPSDVHPGHRSPRTSEG